MRKMTSLLRSAASTLLVASLSCIALAQQPQSQTRSSVVEKRAAIEGAVKVPMLVELRRPVRLIEFLAIAGGVKENAKGTILITHADGTSATYRLKEIKRRGSSSNPYIQAGDIITVAE